MASGTYSYISRSRKSAVESANAEFEQWKQAHLDAMAACDVDEWIMECVRAKEVTVDTYNRALRALRLNRLHGDPQEHGEFLKTIFESALQFFESIAALMATVKGNGYALDNEGAFDKAYGELTQARDTFAARWPWTSATRWQKTAEQIKRGDCSFTEDILHGLENGGPKRD